MRKHLSRLFLESKQYLAPLQGVELDAGLEEDPSLLSAACAEPFLANLHFTLQKAHPEAGAPYYLHKVMGIKLLATDLFGVDLRLSPKTYSKQFRTIASNSAASLCGWLCFTRWRVASR